jgi:outer membrane lipoprotein LolB
MRAALLLTLALLAGCAGAPAILTAPPWEQRADRLAQLAHWRAEGKLALRSGDRAEAANLLWQQAERESNLQLSGPLGMGTTRIHSDGRILEIRRGDEIQVFDISSPDAIRRNTGWDLPLAALPFWLKGLPQPGVAADDLQFEEDLLRGLRQAGWQVQFETYGRFGDYTLPTRLRVQRGPTSARLVIRQWHTGTSS